MYDYKILKEQEEVKDGLRQRAIVIEITEGERRDFVPLEVAKQWKDFKPEQSCIQIIAETKYKDQNFRMYKTVTMPEKGMVHKKSSMAEWKKIYAEYPHVGQEVDVISSNGRWNFLV